MLNQEQLKVNEIYAFFKDEKYYKAIQEVVMEIYNSGCEVLLSKNAMSSKDKFPPNKCSIILGVNSERPKEHILWDLFHELGHHLDMKTKRLKMGSVEREKVAWYFSDKQLLKYPELTELVDNYITYRKSCLSTYLIDDYLGLIWKHSAA